MVFAVGVSSWTPTLLFRVVHSRATPHDTPRRRVVIATSPCSLGGGIVCGDVSEFVFRRDQLRSCLGNVRFWQPHRRNGNFKSDQMWVCHSRLTDKHAYDHPWSTLILFGGWRFPSRSVASSATFPRISFNFRIRVDVTRFDRGYQTCGSIGVNLYQNSSAIFIHWIAADDCRRGTEFGTAWAHSIYWVVVGCVSVFVAHNWGYRNKVSSSSEATPQTLWCGVNGRESCLH